MSFKLQKAEDITDVSCYKNISSKILYQIRIKLNLKLEKIVSKLVETRQWPAQKAKEGIWCWTQDKGYGTQDTQEIARRAQKTISNKTI